MRCGIGFLTSTGEAFDCSRDAGHEDARHAYVLDDGRLAVEDEPLAAPTPPRIVFGAPPPMRVSKARTRKPKGKGKR